MDLSMGGDAIILAPRGFLEDQTCLMLPAGHGPRIILLSLDLGSESRYTGRLSGGSFVGSKMPSLRSSNSVKDTAGKAISQGNEDTRNWDKRTALKTDSTDGLRFVKAKLGEWASVTLQVLKNR